MGYNKVLVADSVVQRLIENQGIYSFMNRSFDGLVQQGASAVSVPNIAVPTVKKGNSGTPLVDASRAAAHGSTNMANVPLTPYAVPLAEEVLNQWETNGNLIKEYLNSASMVLQQQFDIDTITAAQTTSQISAFAGASMAWADVIAIMKTFDLNKVPKAGRVIVIDANLADQFFSIDVVKSAMAFNQQFLSTGTMLNIMGMKFFVSGLVPQVSVAAVLKYNMVGIYGPGLAFILSRMGELKQAWDTINLQNINDMLAYAGVSLFDNKFAVVKYQA